GRWTALLFPPCLGLTLLAKTEPMRQCLHHWVPALTSQACTHGSRSGQPPCVTWLAMGSSVALTSSAQCLRRRIDLITLTPVSSERLVTEQTPSRSLNQRCFRTGLPSKWLRWTHSVTVPLLGQTA